jgi:hypothetical protein
MVDFFIDPRWSMNYNSWMFTFLIKGCVLQPMQRPGIHPFWKKNVVTCLWRYRICSTASAGYALVGFFPCRRRRSCVSPCDQRKHGRWEYDCNLRRWESITDMAHMCASGQTIATSAYTGDIRTLDCRRAGRTKTGTMLVCSVSLGTVLDMVNEFRDRVCISL